jgi:hypothetical protein
MTSWSVPPCKQGAPGCHSEIGVQVLGRAETVEQQWGYVLAERLRRVQQRRRLRTRSQSQ